MKKSIHMKWNVGCLVAVLALMVSSCGTGNPESELSAEKPSPLSSVVLPAEVVESAGITFGNMELKMLSHDINARGQIIVLPDHKAVVSVMMGGNIQSIPVSYGQHVRKGQVLATYTHPAIIAMQQAYIDAKLEFEKMEKEYQRQETLWKDKVKSDKEFQQVRMEYERSRTEYSAAKAKVVSMNIDVSSLDRGEILASVPIVSPINGKVEDVHIAIGQYVDTGDPLFLIIDRSSLVLRLKVFEKDIRLVEQGQRVTFASPTAGELEFEAEIYNLGSVVDQEGNVIYVMARIRKGNEDLIPGMFVPATIHTREQFLNALPEGAVVIENESTRFGFYSLDAEGSQSYRFFPFLVNTGFSEDEYIQVDPVDSLPPDARIVLSGVYYLKSEMMKLLGD